MTARHEYAMGPSKNDADNVCTAKFTATTDSATNVVPDEWQGRYVRIVCVGGNLHFFFSTDSTATCDRTVAASAAGATDATVGDYLADGESLYMIIPDRNGTPVYFVREADATTTVYISARN